MHNLLKFNLSCLKISDTVRNSVKSNSYSQEKIPELMCISGSGKYNFSPEIYYVKIKF